MPKWRERYPGSFSGAYSSTVKTCLLTNEEQYLPVTYKTREEAAAIARDFLYWRYCIRACPTYALHEVETTMRIATRLIQHGLGWRVRVEVKPRFAALLFSTLPHAGKSD